jgi:tetratricopeptide (TPR) repeat protein
VFRELRPFGLIYGMLFRSRSVLGLVIASGLLVAGCHTARHPSSHAREDSVQPGGESVAIDQPGRRPPARSIVSSVPRTIRIGKEPAEAHARYAHAVVLELNGEVERALDEYVAAALGDLGNEQLVLEVSRRLLQSRQSERALDLLIRATSRPDATGPMFARLGFIYAQLGKIDLSIEANRAAIRKEPRSLVGYQNLFLVYAQNRRPREALKVLDEASRVSNVTPEFLIGISELYAAFGLQNPKEKEAAHARGLALLQRAEKAQMTDPQLRLRLADGFNMFGQEEQAAAIYREVLKDFDNIPLYRENVRAKLADIYLRENDSRGAMEQLQEIIRDNPTAVQAYYYLGSIAYENRDFAEAMDSFSKVVLLSPDFQPAYYDLAGAQISGDKPAEALETLEKARLKFPQNFLLEYLTGMAFSQQKDYTNAVKHFTAAEIVAQATEPKHLTEMFYFQFGAACERAGDFDQAEQLFTKCLELAPHFSEAQNYLGYMWAERGKNLDRARQLIEQALKAEPKNAAYLDSMGWVLFKLNNPQAALQYLLEAIEHSEEEDATIYDHLGDVYFALNEPDKARDAWRKSVAIEPNHSVRKKLESSAAGHSQAP